MSISSQLAASRLIQPGVVANSAARPASPFTGQCIYQVDTSQLLVWSGSAWVIPNQTTQNPEGLEFIKTQALSSGGSYTISDVFSSTYRNYRVVGSFTRDTSLTAYVYIRLGGSATDHTMSGQYMAWNNGTRNADNGADGYAFFTSLGANSFVSDILAPNLAQYSYINTVGNSQDYTTTTAIRVANSTQYTSFQFILGGSTNFTGGSLSVYGYRN